MTCGTALAVQFAAGVGGGAVVGVLILVFLYLATRSNP